MTEEEAKIEIEKILLENIAESDQIIKDAIKKGIWAPGLDSNNYLFKNERKDMIDKIEAIKKQIDR